MAMGAATIVAVGEGMGMTEWGEWGGCLICRSRGPMRSRR